MIIYDKYSKVGSLENITLKSGHYYTLRFNSNTQNISNFIPEIQKIQGKDVLIKNIKQGKGYIDVFIYVPKENPILLTIAIISIATLLAGYGINLAFKNITKITESVFSPYTFITIVTLIVIYFYLKYSGKL